MTRFAIWQIGPRRKQTVLIAGGCACLVAGAFLIVLGMDLARWPGTLQSGDRRYRATPKSDSLWRPSAFGVSGLARDVLAISDDLAFRRAVRAFRLSELEAPSNSDPTVVLERAEAEERLGAIARDDADLERRSRALLLLGVLRVSARTSDPTERAAVLKASIADFQQAIAFDPRNRDAKFDLELALRKERGVQTARGGPTPDPNADSDSSKGAATSPPGSGY